MVICPFPEGIAAGQRLKYEQYFDDWRADGFEIEISSFMDEAMWSVVYTEGNFIRKFIGTLKGYLRRFFNIFSLRKYNIVYIFMWVTPIGPPFFEYIFRKLSTNLIYDLEDNAMLNKTNKLNPMMSILRGNKKIDYLIRNADHLITSSPFLNEYCMEKNKNNLSTYISSSLNMERYIPTNKYNNEKKIVIGWTGTFSSKEYLESLETMFKELSKRVDFKLLIIGNFDYELEGVDLEVIKWNEKTEILDLCKIDIGVYPLPQDDWVLGKSGLKALQYMALGLPTVATDVGTTPMIISHMIDGWLVSEDNEAWIDALETLIKDAGLRKKLGENARKRIIENYSTVKISNQYSKILNKLIQTNER